MTNGLNSVYCFEIEAKKQMRLQKELKTIAVMICHYNKFTRKELSDRINNRPRQLMERYCIKNPPNFLKAFLMGLR